MRDVAIAATAAVRRAILLAALLASSSSSSSSRAGSGGCWADASSWSAAPGAAGTAAFVAGGRATATAAAAAAASHHHHHYRRYLATIRQSLELQQMRATKTDAGGSSAAGRTRHNFWTPRATTTTRKGARIIRRRISHIVGMVAEGGGEDGDWDGTTGGEQRDPAAGRRRGSPSGRRRNSYYGGRGGNSLEDALDGLFRLPDPYGSPNDAGGRGNSDPRRPSSAAAGSGIPNSYSSVWDGSPVLEDVGGDGGTSFLSDGSADAACDDPGGVGSLLSAPFLDGDSYLTAGERMNEDGTVRFDNGNGRPKVAGPRSTRVYRSVLRNLIEPPSDPSGTSGGRRPGAASDPGGPDEADLWKTVRERATAFSSSSGLGVDNATAEELHRQVFEEEAGFYNQSRLFLDSLLDSGKAAEAAALRHSEKYRKLRNDALESLARGIEEFEKDMVTEQSKLPPESSPSAVEDEDAFITSEQQSSNGTMGLEQQPSKTPRCPRCGCALSIEESEMISKGFRTTCMACRGELLAANSDLSFLENDYSAKNSYGGASAKSKVRRAAPFYLAPSRVRKLARRGTSRTAGPPFDKGRQQVSREARNTATAKLAPNETKSGSSTRGTGIALTLNDLSRKGKGGQQRRNTVPPSGRSRIDDGGERSDFGTAAIDGGPAAKAEPSDDGGNFKNGDDDPLIDDN